MEFRTYWVTELTYLAFHTSMCKGLWMCLSGGSVLTWMFVHPQLWSCDELVVNPTLLTVSTCSVTAVALLTPNSVTRVKMKEWGEKSHRITLR